jgi:DNA-binding phage protein
MTNNEKLPHLRDAIDRGGGIMAFAKALGVKHQAVYAWFRAGGVPLERAIQIEALTKVPRTKLIKPSLARALQVADQLDVL